MQNSPRHRLRRLGMHSTLHAPRAMRRAVFWTGLDWIARGPKHGICQAASLRDRRGEGGRWERSDVHVTRDAPMDVSAAKEDGMAVVVVVLFQRTSCQSSQVRQAGRTLRASTDQCSIRRPLYCTVVVVVVVVVIVVGIPRHACGATLTFPLCTPVHDLLSLIHLPVHTYTTDGLQSLLPRKIEHARVCVAGAPTARRRRGRGGGSDGWVWMDDGWGRERG
ncbi:hypothetical protein P171DRAFT_60212 [Karstenula rhodostoma CBS 690.94]|uniref:Uncharacterized protein n=1 Tax=Karstenula rhodostoma CBS 690.94 TaxID=1392251 RepID=A0A9P4U9C3_9PLEO|nr:hypothetical protein P171DRAFT_60212 [Karstenula rhodostoma CBS 690.94]